MKRASSREGFDLNVTLRPFLDREKRKQKEIQEVDWAKRQLEDISLNGFSVDEQGNLFFTVPVLFSAFRLSPDGEVAAVRQVRQRAGQVRRRRRHRHRRHGLHLRG